MSDVRDWLDSIGLSQYATAFVEGDIDCGVLRELDHEVLREIGVKSPGHRLRILRAARELSVDSASNANTKSGPPEPSGDAERRQLTVMFADLVGSTALSQRLDPEELRDINRIYQDTAKAAIESYGGYIARYMGDGVLAYFGYPRAHEDDAERAVRAGLQLSLAVPAAITGQELAVRVGIATGHVVVGDLIGDGAAQESAVVGETPNLAARLQEMANPNAVVIASTTRRLLRELFDLKDLGGRKVKGFSEPIHAWQVAGEGQAESRFEALYGQRLTALIGREHELAMLAERWERAIDGEGQVVLLSGEPGIGKSRAVHALRERSADQPHATLSYDCSPYHTNSALHPVIACLERSAGITREDIEEAKLHKVEALLSRGTDTLHEAIPLVCALLGVPFDDRYTTPFLSSQHQRQRTLEVLVAHFEGLAAHQPVLAIFEDLHWADPSTIELLGLLIERCQHVPVLVLATFRPEFVPPWIGQPHVIQLPLSRLTRRCGRDLVAQVMANRQLPGHVVDEIISKTEGVPLFIEELTKTVLETVPRSDAKDQAVGRGSELCVPETLHDSLMARLDHLAVHSRYLAQVGATIGREFSLDVLEAVSGHTSSELDSELQELVDSGLVHRLGQDSVPSYQFKHALVRDVAYDTLLKTNRAKLHEEIAELLEEKFPEKAEHEPELLAHHFSAGGNHQAAVRYWRRAGLRGLARSSHHEAVECFLNALALLDKLPHARPTLEQAVDVRFELRGAMIIVNPERALELVDEAEALARELGDELRTGWACQYAMVSHTFHGDFERAIDAGNRALSLSDAVDDVGLRAVTCTNIAFCHMNHSDFAGAKPYIESSLALLQGDLIYEREKFRMNHTPSVLALTRRAWISAECGEFAEAMADASQALQIAKAVNHPASLMEGYMGLGRVHLICGEVEELREILEGLADLENIYREPTYFHLIAEFLGLAYLTCDRVNDAVAILREAVEATATNRLFARQTRNLVALGETYLHADRLSDAALCARRALERGTGCGEKGNLAYVYRLLGKVASAGEPVDDTDAQTHFERAIELARTLIMRPFEARCRLELAGTLKDSGFVDIAAEQLAVAKELFRSMNMPLGKC